MASTNPARGMRDFLPADVRKRNYVIDIIKQVYESYGFEPLETPAVENLETLMGKYGEEGNQLIFKILKRGEKLDVISKPEGLKTLEESTTMRIYIRNIMRATNTAFEEGEVSRNVFGEILDAMKILSESLDSFEDVKLSDLALRYDLTVPLARVVAHHRAKLPKFFKRYQIQPVWRADRPARGRFREFYQCDVDAIGSSSMVVEAEQIAAVCEILTRLGFDDFTVRLNHREVLRDILDTAGVAADKHADALVAIDKLDKIGSEGVEKELETRGIENSASRMLLDIFEETRKIVEEGKDVNRTIVSNLINIVSNEVLAGIGRILRFTAGRPVRLDPSLARGLSYYTGSIMEINVPDLAGSLGGGGRYDGLIGMFGKEQIPACGFSLGLERILVVMDERGMFPPEIAESTPADVMVAVWSEETAGESLKLAAELRSAGLRVTVYPEADKLGKQLKYADAIRVPYVCVLGEAELSQGKVSVKNMKTGEQKAIERNAVAGSIKTV